MQRIEMNTKSLQKHFPDVYRDFFVKNDLVVSGCFNFPWGPSWVWERSNYFNIKSKIPLKCYIWFKIKKELWVNFKNVDFYNISTKSFETVPYSKVNKENQKVSEFISDFLSQNHLNSWLEIEFLSETSRGHSFWFTWTSSAVIALWLFILTWKLDVNTLKEYDNFINSDNFKLIELLSVKLSLMTKFWSSAWQNVRHTLHNNSDPSFLLIEKDSLTFNNIETIKTKFFKIWENCKENLISTNIPLDYYMVFSWISTNSSHVMDYIKWNEKKYKDYSMFINNFILWKEFSSIETNLSKYLSDDNLVYKLLTENINILWIKTVELFKKIFETWYDNALIEDFIENINNYNNVVSLIEKQSWFQDHFVYLFKQNIHNNDEQVWILPAYSWKFWWWYVVVTKQGISRNTIEKTITDLRSIYPNVEMEYCSYLDGETSDGVMVEQFISKWIYSSYVDKNKFLFQSNKWDNYIGDYNEIMDREKTGLLFDMINNKIYLNGEKLTSKDIPSQNTTIEVVTRLLDHTWEELSNKELPSSSYSSNKNEMLGKIILPLMKLIEEKTGEQIPLVCKWSLNDFYIKMWDVNIKIWAIKRI